MTYSAIIARLTNVRAHPNADNIKLATVLGNQVVVGLDSYEGELGLMFPVDGQLSEAYCEANDLIGVYVDGKKVGGGFFTENRRVKTQKFRGEKSEGYFAPISSVAKWGLPTDAKEGFSFTELGGVEICRKYETAATKLARERQSSGRVSRGETAMFKKHFETAHLRREADTIPNGALLIITEKLHGTSHRLGRVLDAETPTRLQLFMSRLFRITPNLRNIWRVLHGSRNVILDITQGDQYHGGTFRDVATGHLGSQLRKGEVIYGEIVGYSAPNTPIMPVQDNKQTKDKAVTKAYGPTMTYAYGQNNGECEFIAYRIVQVNEDGQAVELSWAQVKARCNELGIQYVPEIAQVVYSDLIHGVDWLLNRAEQEVNGASLMDSRHIREGICLRVEHETQFGRVLKHKSFLFNVLEGNSKEQDIVDPEEAA